MKKWFSGIRPSWYLLALIIALLAIGIRLNAGQRIIDDSYITYRYAKNILAGNGFVFNPGEHVLGTTTPLYTLLLVIVALPFGGANANFPLLSYTLNAFIDGAICLVLYQFGRRMDHSLLGIASALAISLAPYSVTFSIGGLETSLYVFLLIGIAYTYIQERFEWTALLAALAFLTRPDAMILIVPIIIDYILIILSQIHKTSKPTRNISLQRFLRVGLIFTLPCTLWLLFAHSYFGSFFPNSIAAKALAYHLPQHSALIRLLQHYATPFAEDKTFGKWGIAAGLILYPSLALFGGMEFLRKTKRMLAFTLFPWIYFLVFALANPLIFRWYLTPPLPFYILCIFMGTIALWRRIAQAIQSKVTQLRINCSAIQICSTIILPTLLILPAWQLHPTHGPDRLAPEMAYIQLELHYNEAVNFLEAYSPKPLSSLTIAAGDVGVLGYRTNAYILDTVGLNSPQTLDYFPIEPQYYVINYAIPTQLILDNLPDYVVMLEVYGRKTLLTSKDFLMRYRLVNKIDTDIYGSDGLLIFKKESVYSSHH
ncbi:MAG: hypothetical protein Kow0088_06440 [Anaerolineales bacterium]